MQKLQTRIIIQAGRLAVILALGVFFGLSAPSAKADPLTFSNVVALQNSGATRVDLFGNPGTTIFGPQLTFMVDISGSLPPSGSSLLQITYTEAGSAPIVQTFLIPAFGTVPPPYTQLFTITSPGATYNGISGTLTIDILGSSPDFIIPGGPNAGQSVDSYTYSFNIAKPVPEPGTVLLMLVGISGLVARTKRKS
jgi:PEP-CTERM motif